MEGRDESGDLNEEGKNASKNETEKQFNETSSNTNTTDTANKKAETISLKVEWIPKGVIPLLPEQKKIASER